MPSKLDLAHITAILAASPLVTSWQVVVADETARRALYRIRCHLLRPTYQLGIRLIQTEDELLYSYQLFTDAPLVRWDNAPHFPTLKNFPHRRHDETGVVTDAPLHGDPAHGLPYVLQQLRTLLVRL